MQKLLTTVAASRPGDQRVSDDDQRRAIATGNFTKRSCQGANRAPVLSLLLLLASLVMAVPAKGQSKIELTIGGGVETPIKLTTAEMSKLPRTTVRARDHSGVESAFEGVALFEFLKLAGVPLGEN